MPTQYNQMPRPPYEEGNDESLPEHMENMIEQGVSTRVDFLSGSISPKDIARLFDAEPKRLTPTEEEDLEAEQKAKQKGGHPNDHSWRFK